MSLQESKILSFKHLTLEEQEYCEQLLAVCRIKAAMIGVIKQTKFSLLLPVILIGKNLKLVKLSPDIASKDSVLLDYLNKQHQVIQKFSYLDPADKFGIVNNKFYLLRDYYPETLAGFLASGTLSAENANALLLKVVNLLLSLKRNNIVHGHICPQNIVLNNEEISLVDFGFAYCAKKNNLTRDIAPEALNYLSPDYPSDVYGLGKLVKVIYKNQQCPLPLDLVDRMCADNPLERPELTEVNNFLTKISSGVLPVINPKEHYAKYLTPELVSHIRTAIKKEKESEPVQQKSQISFLLALFALVALFFILWQLKHHSDTVPPKTTLAADNYTREVQLSVQILEKGGVKNSRHNLKLLQSFYEKGYTSEFLKNYINKSESEDIQLLKLRVLLSIPNQDISVLDSLYTDLEKNKFLSKYFAWYESNKILNSWKDIKKTIKILILSGTIPEGVLSLEYHFDLGKHFDPLIVAASGNTLESILPKEQTSFYQELFQQKENYSRDQVTFLLMALKQKKNIRGALIDQWYQNTKPRADLVLKLVLAREKPQKEEDYFSFYGARYLKNNKTSFTPEEKAKMSKHHEKQLQILTY